MRKPTLISGFLVVSLYVLSAPVFSQSIGFQGVGGRLSFVDPEGTSGVIGVGGHAVLGNITDEIVLYPSIEYWSKGGFNQVAFNGDARYYIPSSGSIDFFAGGGLGFVFNEGNLDLGLDLTGGADFPLSDRLVANGEVRFVISDINVIKLTAGITYLLGN